MAEHEIGKMVKDEFIKDQTLSELTVNEECKPSLKMTSENYVENVLRTDCITTQALIHRLTDPETIRLLHAAMGMVTEAGEFMDMLKKHIFAGKPIDFVNAIEELGDNQWYVGLAVDVLRTTMNEIMTVNINKLKLRYPEKFSEHDCINRNVTAEREFLEKAVNDDLLGEDQ